MNKIKSFFKIVKYEFVRLYRNKVVMLLLLLFSLLALCLLSFVKQGDGGKKVAVFTDGLSQEQLAEQQVIFEQVNGKDFVYVDTIESGKDLVNNYTVSFFLCFDSSTNPVTATIYYDSSNLVGKSIKDTMSNATNELAYQSITQFLSEDWGIKLNENYFKMLDFQTSNKIQATNEQIPYVMELTVCVSFVVMFGLAFAISRDNETQINNNLAYRPISLNTYLLAKTLAFFLLGMLSMLMCLLIGVTFFKIQFQLNIMVVWLLSSFFVLSTTMIGILFSCCKNQIATSLIGTLAIVIPMFATTMVNFQTANLTIKAVLLVLPVGMYINFLNAMLFSGIVIWWCVPLFILQSVIYYLIALWIMKKRAN